MQVDEEIQSQQRDNSVIFMERCFTPKWVGRKVQGRMGCSTWKYTLCVRVVSWDSFCAAQQVFPWKESQLYLSCPNLPHIISICTLILCHVAEAGLSADRAPQ